ncbi:MAG: hypothetical protein ACYDBI_05855 [Thermoplasmataceae archaeon]
MSEYPFLSAKFAIDGGCEYLEDILVDPEGFDDWMSESRRFFEDALGILRSCGWENVQSGEEKFEIEGYGDFLQPIMQEIPADPLGREAYSGLKNMISWIFEPSCSIADVIQEKIDVIRSYLPGKFAERLQEERKLEDIWPDPD